MFSFLLPKLFDSDDNEKFKDWRTGLKIIGTWVIFTILFVDLQTVPLSDIPAFTVCICATLILKKLHDADLGNLATLLLSLMFGVLLYWMYNIRTIYLFAALALVIALVVVIFRSKWKALRGIIAVSGTIIGAAISSIPQVIWNWTRYGMLSPSVKTNGLFAAQLFWGLQYQRYDTYVGAEGPGAQVFYIDHSGNALLSAAGALSQVDGVNQITVPVTIREYIKICLQRPLEVIGIYVRHFVNMLTPFWNTAYVDSFSESKILIVVVSFLIIFLFGYVTFNRTVKDKTIYKWLIPVLVPVVLITPGAVETRFYIALYLTVICTLAYNTDWSKTWRCVKENKLRTAISCLISFCLIIAIWTNTLGSYAGDFHIFIE